MVSPPQSAPSLLPSVPRLPLLLLLLLPSRFSSPLFISPPSFPPSLPPSNTSVLLTGLLYFISRPNLSHRFVEVMLRRPPQQTGVGEKKRFFSLSFFFLSFFWGGGGARGKGGGGGGGWVLLWERSLQDSFFSGCFLLSFSFWKKCTFLFYFCFCLLMCRILLLCFVVGGLGAGGGGGSVLLLLLLLLDWTGCGWVFLYNDVLKCDNAVTQPWQKRFPSLSAPHCFKQNSENNAVPRLQFSSPPILPVNTHATLLHS